MEELELHQLRGHAGAVEDDGTAFLLPHGVKRSDNFAERRSDGFGGFLGVIEHRSTFRLLAGGERVAMVGIGCARDRRPEDIVPTTGTAGRPSRDRPCSTE